VPAYP